MLALTLDTLWRVARLRQFDAYLGNPDVNGTSTSEYAFRLAPPLQRPEVRASAAPVTASPATTLAAILVIIILGVGLAVAWARS